MGNGTGYSTLRATFSDVPRIRPLVKSKPDIGISIDWNIEPSSHLVVDHIRKNEYDIFEYSIAGYITALQAGLADQLGWTALPVFLSRPIRIFENFVVRADSEIDSLADLAGKRVGILEYRMTAGVWLRAILRQLHGIEAAQISWVNSWPMKDSYMAELGAPNTMPSDVAIENRSSPDLAVQVSEGDLDAAFNSTADISQLDVRRPFDQSATIDIFADMMRSMGATPANHLVVVKRAALEANPGLALRLYKAFETSKHESYAEGQAAAAAYLWAPSVEFDRQADAFGPDPYPSGLAANKAMLQLVIDQMKDDLQLPGDVLPEQIFPDELHST